jgi:peptide/nickel transport system permease protein
MTISHKPVETTSSTARQQTSPDVWLKPRETPSLLKLAWQRFRRDKLALVGGVVMIILILVAVSAPLLSKYITHYTPQQIELDTTLKPMGYQKSPDHPTHFLGTDELGRDVLTRVIYGGRVSLWVAFLTVLVSLTIGTVIGAVAGYYGGSVDTLLMRFVDIIISIPTLFLLILIAVVFRPDVSGLALVIASLNWTGVSRLVRGEFLSLKERDFVDAARVVGASNARIIFVAATLALGGVILIETALSYLGMGVQPPTPSWGNMLTNSRQYLYRAPFLIVIPGIFIFVTVLAANLMGNGLRDALDPRLRD